MPTMSRCERVLRDRIDRLTVQIADAEARVANAQAPLVRLLAAREALVAVLDEATGSGPSGGETEDADAD